MFAKALLWLSPWAAAAWSTSRAPAAAIPRAAVALDDGTHHSPIRRRRETLAGMLSARHLDDDILAGGDIRVGTDADPTGDEASVDGGASAAAPLAKVPSHLVSTLDLAPLMAHVASYACTRRGKEAIVNVASAPSPAASAFDKARGGRKPSLFGSGNRQRRRDWFDGRNGGPRQNDFDGSVAPIFVAQSAEEATSEYELVREAMDILHSQRSVDATIPLPPMFDLHEGVSMGADSDEDEWVDLLLDPLPPGTDLYQEIDLEAILKAEQVVKLLLETYNWSMDERVGENAPGVVGVVREMELDGRDDTERSIEPLSDLYQALKGAVEIVRAGPSLSDVDNRFSYQFQLASGSGRFPELDALREKEGRLLERKDDVSQQLSIARNEMAILEEKITRTMITAMTRTAHHVQHALYALARLDAVFARASFGLDWNGLIPAIGKEGRIHVENFVHPVLALEKEIVNGDEGKAMGVVPVDLLLPGRGGYQSLMISGPNGGGKTLALKSFGLVAVMAKLGLPITVSNSYLEGSAPVVDFYEEVHVEVGDEQSISRQESTLMARLNALSSLIEAMSAPTACPNEAKLVLLDELGGGTDPVAGSALAQSILEKIISISPTCKLVATTHSPQLKALSVSDGRFECASVLMGNEKYPTFQLCYGTTGDSFALEAARRCRPSLPEDVIERAAQLMNAGDDDSVDSLKHYLSTLDEEKRKVQELARESESAWKEICECRDDMLGRVQASKTKLSRLESRIESIFDTLQKDDTRSSYELVGDSLEELRLLKRKVQTEEEMLSEKGLRRVSDSHSFYEGEMVVIVTEGEWKGYDAVVKATDDPKRVTVVPVLDLFSINEDDPQDPLVLSRRDVAVFDYPDPDWGFANEKHHARDSYSTRKQSTSSVLSTLSALNTSVSKSAATTNSQNKGEQTSFTSARQRKAAAAATKQKKGGKRKKKK